MKTAKGCFGNDVMARSIRSSGVRRKFHGVFHSVA